MSCVAWTARRTLLAGLILAVTVGLARAQQGGADAALRDRVNQLVGRLSADDEARRAEAVQALNDLGPRILPLLPEPGTLSDLVARSRLEELRRTLAERAAQVNLGPSLVTIQGEAIRLSEALRMLQQQSGNRVSDLREQYGQDVTNPSLALDLVEKPFFEALDAICEQGGVVPNFYTGDGSVGLMTANDPSRQPPGTVEADQSRPDPRVVYSGPFRVQLMQIAARRDFVSGLDEAGARLEVAWEPRLRPMLMELAASNIEILDNRGELVAPSVMMESENVVLRPENPVAEVNLNMNAPDRAAESLEQLSVKATVTVPGGVRTFRFADLSTPAKESVGDLSVQLVSTQVEDFVWKVRVMLQYPGEGPAFESYRQGLFNNQLWLQKPDGTRFEHNGGFSNLGTGGGRLGFEYLFVDVPGKPADWGFVYETPSALETIPLEFEFKDIPLP